MRQNWAQKKFNISVDQIQKSRPQIQASWTPGQEVGGSKGKFLWDNDTKRSPYKRGDKVHDHYLKSGLKQYSPVA